VPLVLHIPGMTPQMHGSMTSHLDLPATLFAALGQAVGADVKGMGQDLLGKHYNRPFAIVSDWHGDALVTQKYKYSMSDKANLLHRALFGLQDTALTQDTLPDEVMSALRVYVDSLSVY
jgi:hypothetical protein